MVDKALRKKRSNVRLLLAVVAVAESDDQCNGGILVTPELGAERYLRSSDHAFVMAHHEKQYRK